MMSAQWVPAFAGTAVFVSPSHCPFIHPEMLTVSGVHSFYGNIEALKGVELEVGAGEIVALIGANGAGKSTLLMTICGRPQAASGQILFEGRDITRLPTF